MHSFWKHVKCWLHGNDTRRPMGRRPSTRLGIDFLEERSTPAGNLSFSNITLLDGTGQAITSPVVGERVSLKIDWNATGLAANDQYVVRGTVGGISFDSAAFTGVSSGSLSITLTGWYAVSASNSYQVRLDPLGTVAETNEADNDSATLNFTGAPPTNLPMRFVFPVSNSTGPFTEWAISSYVDLDPSSGGLRDFGTGTAPLAGQPPLVADGSIGMNVGLPTFRAMDRGVTRVLAAASGTVEAVVDGFDDRNSTGAAGQSNYIRINHGNGWRTEYFNLARGSTTLLPGVGVAQGQTIALIGSSGASSSPHLRFVVTHNNAPVEPNLLPASYWVSPLTHQFLQPRRILDSGISNYDPAGDLLEKPTDSIVFPSTLPSSILQPFTWDASFYGRINYLKANETVQVRWFAPGNPTAVSVNQFTEVAPFITNRAFEFSLPSSVYRTSPGIWTVELHVAGFVVATRQFQVAPPSNGVPNAYVTAAGRYVPAGRTSPIEFGSTTVGGPGNNQTFVISNIGTVAMNVTNVALPSGFGFVGTAPAATTTLLPTQSLTFTIRLDSTSAGEKTGALRFQTSSIGGSYNLFLHGTVAGTPPAGAPSAFFPSGAATTFTGTAPFVIEPNASFADPDSPSLSGGRLVVEFLNSNAVENNLAIRNQGSAAGQIGTNGNNVSFGTQNFGTATVVAGTSLTVNFTNDFATPAALQALLRNITYANSNATPTPGLRYIKFSIFDNTNRVSNIIVRAVYPAPPPNFSPRVTIVESAGSTLAVEGGASDSYTIQLTQAPAAGRTVTVTILPVSQVSVDVTTLVFDASNFNIPRSVTVAAFDDTLPEGSHRGTIIHSVTSGDPNFDGALIPVVSPLLTDNDVGLVVNETFGTTTVSEEGANDTVSFSLATVPTGNVTVTLSPNAFITTTPTTLTFTPATWNIPQTVTIAPVDDGIIQGPHNGTITIATSSSDSTYNLLNVAPITVAIVDNDFIGVRINVPGSGLVTSESGGTSSFTARLTSQPTADVTLTMNPNGQVATTPTSLTFTPQNWSVDQTVVVNAVDDAIDEGDDLLTHTGTIGLTVTSADAGYNNFAIPAQTVLITDNDTAGVTLAQSGNSTDVAEGGATDTITLRLNSQPTSPVTITLNGGNQLTLGPASVTFNATDWDQTRTITIAALDDSTLEGFHVFNMTFAVASADPLYDQFAVSPVTVNITDNDAAAVVITPSGGSLDLSEAGATDTFTVRLAVSQPTSDVMITLLPNSQVRAQPTTLTFTPQNWNQDQTVTVTAVDDAVAEGTHVGSIGFVTASNDVRYQGMSLAALNASIVDNDVAGVLVTQSAGSTDVAEAGTSDSLSVVLNSQPASNVVISLQPNNQVSVSPGTLTFTPLNWNVAQPVSVGAVDDSFIEGAHTGSIGFSVTSSDPLYQGLAVASVSVAVSDNDALGVIVNQSASSTEVTEGGQTDTYTIVLTTPPFEDVIIDLSPDSQVTVSPMRLVFTAGNFNLPQIVTVTANNDRNAEGTHASVITHTASSTDSRYNGITIANVAIAITDDDVAGVQVDPSGGTTLAVEGGATDTITVYLKSQPTGTVVLNLVTDGQVSTTPSSLSFSPLDFDVPRTVTVTAINDRVAEGNHNGVVTFQISTTDAVYQGLPAPTYAVPLRDNDTANVTFTQTGGSTVVSEGVGTDTYNVVLTSQPTSDVTINLTPSLAGQLAVTPGSLTFTPANWNVSQTIQVGALDDAVAEGRTTVVLNHSVTSLDAVYAALNLSGVNVIVNDNDVAGINLLALGSFDLTEGTFGQSSEYQLSLNSRPTTDVTVTLTTSGQVTPSTPTLLFTPTNWNVPQTVTVTAVDDAIAEGLHGDVIQHRATSADAAYANLVGSNVTVSITDNDVGILIQETGGSTTVFEGELADTYQVTLSQAPLDDVIVTLLGADPLMVSPATLTFTIENWNVPQTVSVSTPPDAINNGSRSRLITHTLASGDSSFGGKVRDLNVTVRDPLPDILGRLPDGRWFVNRSTGSSFTVSQTLRWAANVTWLDVRVGDFTGDGRDDLAGRNKVTGDWWVSVSQGNGTFVQQKWGKWAPQVTWVHVLAIDLNGDGRKDLLGRVLQDGRLIAAISTGTGFVNQQWGRWSVGATWVDVLPGDFDGDGKTDVVARVLKTGDWWVARNTGTALVQQNFGRWNPQVNWLDVRAGDVDGDGKTDVVGRALAPGQSLGQLHVGISSGTSFATSIFGAWGGGNRWLDVALFDFDGDGKADLVGRLGADLWVSRSTGTSFTITPWASQVPPFVEVRYEDFDGDGKADVAGRANNGRWLVYISQGTTFHPLSLWSSWPIAAYRDLNTGKLF